MFTSKAVAYSSKANVCASLYGRLVALLAKIRLGYKGLPGTNTLAYEENLSIMPVESFIKFAMC
jgi:hypothetical protein